MKRLFDCLLCVIGLSVLFPLFLALAVLIRLDSPGPVFFRQQRVGQYGRLFRIHKFRTMVSNAESTGLQITVGDDRRITKVGKWLRRSKLDELPQLLDVLFGNMSFVGPRPEVPRYVACYPPHIRDVVLSVRPGITDYASILFKEESHILSFSSDPVLAYAEEILPVKLCYAVDYVRTRSFVGDILCILKTIHALFGLSVSTPPSV